MARHLTYDDTNNQYGNTYDKAGARIYYLKNLEKVGQADIAGKQRNENSFLNTSETDGEPLIESSVPPQVQNLRIKMLDHIAKQKKYEEARKTGNPSHIPYARENVKKAALEVKTAHDAAIGKYPHPNNPDIEIGKEKTGEGYFSPTLRYIKYKGQKTHLHNEPGGYHKNPHHVTKNFLTPHQSSYIHGGKKYKTNRKTKRKSKTKRKTKRKTKSKTKRKSKTKSKTKRKTKRK